MAIRGELEEGCKRGSRWFKLNKIKKMNPAVYSVDCMYKNTTRCDWIVICDLNAEKVGIYLIEKKGRRFEVDHVVKQLEGCAQFVGEKLEQDEGFNFMPVLVSDRISSVELQKMKKKLIYIRGKPQKIERIKTYGALEKIEA